TLRNYELVRNPKEAQKQAKPNVHANLNSLSVTLKMIWMYFAWLNI
ncbi:8277_t:CDS:1, partial [Racocetra persica]